jgi:hypothetical protein
MREKGFVSNQSRPINWSKVTDHFFLREIESNVLIFCEKLKSHDCFVALALNMVAFAIFSVAARTKKQGK